ncbi:putative nuclear pore protein [Lasiosphaeria ovina]|uniref:Nuclear pore protein n=1 Tax=Lasiosphaeria ovina TaxID=92902 RepID=A0AAE0TYH5_9PEZI|nr:putative nuclear pore protein [Lasiosphaeria ovina]
MSFGSGPFGFGQNNQQQQQQQPASTFGGFGGSSNATTGFGASGSNAFGQNTTPAAGGTSLFGGGGLGGGGGFGANNTAATGGFGSGSFGGGTKPAFGAPAATNTGGGIFGTNPATNTASGFGGGGGFNTAATTSSTPFGGSSLFGANKPATTGFGSGTTGFGSGTTAVGTNTSLFGGGAGLAAGAGFGGATNNPGIGANIGDPPGTAVVPFTPTVEKEANNTSQSNSFQNILFMDAYKKWSSEELRLADYNQGRKQGSAGGTGAFGGSGFGTGGFGANTQTSTGFGAGSSLFGGQQQQQPASNAFGQTAATTSGGFGAGSSLFGANKPAATGGLFNSTPAQPAQSGGLFGGGGFGATNTTTTNAFGANNNAAGGTSLFGANTTAQKPGFGFGNTGGSGFGASASTTNAFGANPATTAGGGLFSNTAQQNTGGGGIFGQQPQQQQQPAATGFGAAGGLGAQAQNTGGLFGNNQPKPGGLFANTTTATGGSSLFGGNPAPSGNAFGGNTNQNVGGMFGAKPAGTGTGLFGSATTAQPGNTGTGLFSGLGQQNQAQQPAQSSLFGLGQNNQQKPSLFGGSQPSLGGSLFNNQPAQQQGSLFGNNTNNQQNAQGGGFGLGNSLLGNSQNMQPAQQSFSTSINDMSAYGSSTLFSGLADDKVQNPGPLATPLSSKAKAKSRAILPMYKLSPANATRFMTPQKRGFGFSYSTYGSPSSPSSAASTPGGFGQSLLVGSVNRGLSKSISASNLRRTYNAEDSILAPGAFSASSGPRLLGGSSNHKRLVINRDMRSDLFTSPIKDMHSQDATNAGHKLQKRVSFDTSSAGTTDTGSRDRAQDTPDSGSNNEDYLQPKSATRPGTNGVNGSKSSPVTASPDGDQAKGKELAIVHEEESPAVPRAADKKNGSQIDAGAYWMSPTAEEIHAMNRMQRQKVANFVVGRENVGSVSFNIPVDLSNIDLEGLFDNIIVLEPRSATVYPIAAKKPPVGKGLNVPALISLEHSYPRGGLETSGRRLERHIERLKTAIADTTFENYDKETGVWTFTVEHFTTYGLGEDDDEDADETDADLVLGGQTPMDVQLPQYSPEKESVPSPDQEPEDDTFDFKRSRRAVPGAFDEGALSDDEGNLGSAQPHGMLSHHGFQDADAPIPSREWPEDESMADGHDNYQHEAYEDMSQQGSVEDHEEMALSRYAENDFQVPGGIMRARMRALKKSAAPTRIEVAGGNDWTQILQASVKAPRTVDRGTLRAQNESGAAWDLKDRGSPTPQNQPHLLDGNGFATSIDLMKSLFEQAKGPAQPAQSAPAKGFVKWPYQTRTKVDTEDSPAVSRPNWGPNETLVTTHVGATNLLSLGGNIASSAPSATESTTKLTQLQQYIDIASVSPNRPEAPGPELRALAQGDPVWELAALLFEDDGSNLVAFWRQLISQATNQALDQASSPEEKAIICLAGNRVPEACGHLLTGRDFRLATLVSCIGSQTKDIRTQLKDWRESNVLAEISEPVRAIYELLSGNACVCAGVKNVPIENRVASFTISQRFGLDWMQSFGLRLFYTTGSMGGAAEIAEAVRSFQSDIEQDKEPEPNSPLWSLLKAFAFRLFDWSDTRLGWLLAKAIFTTGKVSFGQNAAETLDMVTISFASTLTAQTHWVPATFVLLQLSDGSAREAAVRDHLGRHAHLIGSKRNEHSAFSALRKFGVPESWIWEAKALDFRSRQDSRQEYLSLIWAGNYAEANRAFVDRVGPDLVIERDFKRLFAYAQLLFKVRKSLPDWDRAAAVYLLYPIALLEGKQHRQEDLDRYDSQLFDGLVALRAASHGGIRQEAAIADMAEELIKTRGGDARLFQLLPDDIRGKYMRTQALESMG